MSTLKDVRFFLSTLKRLDNKSRALASHPELTLQLLFQSMTRDERVEAIGHLSKMNDYVGSLYVECLRINQSGRSSRTDFMISHSSGGASALCSREQAKTPSSSILPSTPNHSKVYPSL